MRISVAIVLLILVAQSMYGQTRRGYPVNAGQSPGKVIPDSAKYLLPAFTEGTAFLRSGGSLPMRFNYNYLLDEMQFLNAKGDTMAIADPATLKKIVLDSIIFYFDKEYLKEIERAGNYKLAVWESLVQTPYKTEGAYGTKTASSSIESFSRIYANGKEFKLQVQKDVLFVKVVDFYMGDAYDHFSKANKKAFSNLFSLKKEELDAYIREEKINFNSEEDLKKLLYFCAEN